MDYQMGEVIEVREIEGKKWVERMFIKKGRHNGVVCVNYGDDEKFNNGGSFKTVYWTFHRKKSILGYDVEKALREAFKKHDKLKIQISNKDVSEAVQLIAFDCNITWAHHNVIRRTENLDLYIVDNHLYYSDDPAYYIKYVCPEFDLKTGEAIPFEEPVKEVTITELEEKYGCRIKIVEEK